MNNSKKETDPPRLAIRLLAYLLKEDLQEEIFGDLEEKFQLALEERPASAKRNYWYQTLHYLRPFALKKITLQNAYNMGLIRHNFLISFRSFRKFRSTFLINLLGMSTGLACAILIYLWVMDEYRTDRFHDNNKQLFQIIQTTVEPDGEMETEGATSPLLAEALIEEIPGIRKATSVREEWFRQQPGLIQSEDKMFKASEYYINPGFFQLFSYELSIGDSQNPLPDNQSMLVSERVAKHLFSEPEQAVGQLIEWSQDRSQGKYAITGVFKSPPGNSTRQFDVLLPIDLLTERDSFFSSWDNFNVNTYLELAPNVELSAFNKQIKDFMMSKQTEDIRLFAMPYADTYLYGNFENGEAVAGRMQYVRLFSWIAFFILLIACINFMNLSTAKAASRLKEIGVKKSIGATRKDLIGQYFSESTLIAFLALVLAILLVILVLPQFSQLTGKVLTLNFDGSLLLGILAITLLAGLLAGFYPAIYLSRFQAIQVIKGKLANSFGDVWLRKGLVVFQFSMSILLILSVIIISRQIDYVQNKQLGFNRDQVLQFGYNANSVESYQTFLEEARNIPGVRNATGFNHNLTGEYGTTTGLSWEGKDPSSAVSFVTLESGFQFIETLDIPLLMGRGFQAKTDQNDDKIILNESAVEKIGFSDPIGKRVNLWGKDREIIGVVKDFHFASMYEDIQPGFIRANPLLAKTMVKIQAGEESKVIASLKQVFDKRMPGLNFEYNFLDDDFQKMYQAETQVATLAKNFALLSILITCLGLLGLTTFIAERRAKEICIRKVVGASSWSIVQLLSKDFNRLLLIALLIALPVGYLLAQQWLANFVYSFSLQIAHFLIAGLVIVSITWSTIGIQFLRATRMNPAARLRGE